MRCPSCGAKNKNARGRCAQCGAPLDPRVAAFGGAARLVRESWGLGGHEEAVPAPQRTPSRYLLFGAVAAALVTVVVAGACALQSSDSASGGYTLDTESFDDESLLAIVQEFDLDGDGRLSPSEAEAVTALDCSGLGLRELAGIELFTNLEVLNASNNLLTTLDLSQLAHLREVNLADNTIHELNIANHGELVRLNVSDNHLSSLDVSGCTALEVLICPGNTIARLDLDDCRALTELVCDASQNVTIPLSEGFFPDAGLRDALKTLDSNGDGVLTQRERQNATALAVTEPTTASLYGLSWVEGLAELNISNTLVGGLDAQELPAALVTLTASNCQLTSVDLGGLDRLVNLDLSYNPLVSVDLSGLPRLTHANLANCELAGTLDVATNTRLESLDVSGNPRLTAVDARDVAGLRTTGAVQHDAGCTVELGEPPATPGTTATVNPVRQAATGPSVSSE